MTPNRVGRPAVRGVAVAITVALVTGLAGCGLHSPTTAAHPLRPTAARSLRPTALAAVTDLEPGWRDDFTGAAGARPNSSRWAIDAGGGRLGVHEMQTYTSRSANVATTGHGLLRIRAVANLARRTVTSGQVNTRGRVVLKNGTLRARVEMPARPGVLASIRLIAATTHNDADAKAGEIDVAEVASDPHTVYTGLRGPTISGRQWSLDRPFEVRTRLDDRFHTYAIAKSPGRLVFGVDGKVTAIVSAHQLPAADRWVFNTAFYVVLGVSVGGSVVGMPDTSTRFPVDMLVDWVSITPSVTR